MNGMNPKKNYESREPTLFEFSRAGRSNIFDALGMAAFTQGKYSNLVTTMRDLNLSAVDLPERVVTRLMNMSDDEESRPGRLTLSLL